MAINNISIKIDRANSFTWTISDIWEIAKRNLIRYSRQPVLIGVTFIQPIMFVLLFVYVFGGAIQAPGGTYVNYLIPGILIQAVLFGAVQTGVGLAEDMKKGFKFDRFRSLCMSRSAVLAGRVTADLLRNIFVLAIIIGIGYAVGFRVQTNFGEALLALILALAFSFAMMWIMAVIGMLVRNAETTQIGTMIITFPLVFVSSAFARSNHAEMVAGDCGYQPGGVATVDTIRGLLVSGQYTPSLWQSLIWVGGLLLVFIPLAINRYQHCLVCGLKMISQVINFALRVIKDQAREEDKIEFFTCFTYRYQFQLVDSNCLFFKFYQLFQILSLFCLLYSTSHHQVIVPVLLTNLIVRIPDTHV